MQFHLLNESSAAGGVTAPILGQIAAACTRQLCECYAPMWEATGGSVAVAATLADVPADSCPVVILDNADQAGALGYHATAPDGRPYARIFLGPILANGGTLTTGQLALSSVISHEVLEAIGDPYTAWWADAPDGKSYALELCDPVESDSYEIDGVSVSNFVGPRYFSAGPGPYDWLGKLTAPFTMTNGGYLIVRSTPGDVQQVFGAEYPEWKKAGKAHPAARSAKRSHR